MSSGKASVGSVIAVLGLLVGIGGLVANWLSVPGFPYNPFRSQSHWEEPTTTAEPGDGHVRTTAGNAPSSSSRRRKGAPSTPSVEPEPRDSAPEPQPTVEARTIARIPAPTPAPVTPAPPVIEDHEPTASDGFYRGTVVTCQHESNVPGAAAPLCVDIGGKTVSAAMDSHLYVLIGGWNKRIPLYAGDVIKFEVRGGALARAELLSDPQGR